MRRTVSLLAAIFVFGTLAGCAGPQAGAGRQTPGAYALNDAAPILADRLIESIGDRNAGKIAVADLIGPGETITGLGEYVSDKISVRLFGSGRFPDFMERRQLKQMIAAITMEHSGYFDQDTASRYGKMIGVDSMVIGTVNDLGSHYDLTVKIVQSETGAILAMADIMLVKEQATAQLVAAKRTATLTVIVDPPVNGQVVAAGQTLPLRNGTATFHGIPYGECAVVITPEGFEAVRKSIPIRAATEVLAESLRARRHTFTFQLFPPEATLFVSGRPIPTNAQGFATIDDLENRSQSFLARAPGYEDATGTIDPSSQQHLTLRLTEVKKPVPDDQFRALGTASISYQCDPKTEAPCPPQSELKRRAVEVAKIHALQEMSQRLGVDVNALSQAAAGRLAAETVTTRSGAVLTGIQFSSPMVNGDELSIEIIARPE